MNSRGRKVKIPKFGKVSSPSSPSIAFVYPLEDRWCYPSPGLPFHSHRENTEREILMMSVRASDVRKLYKALLRNGAKFSDYNFREYSLRRTRDVFRANMNETDPEKVNRFYYKGLEDLAVLKRQTAISQMFKADPVVIER